MKVLALFAIFCLLCSSLLPSTFGALGNVLCDCASPVSSITAIIAPDEQMRSITETCLYNFDPLKPHFYIVKLGFTGVYISFHISAQNIDCRYSLEPPRRGGSNEYPQSMF